MSRCRPGVEPCATVRAELDQLRLQVEVMAVRVDQNLERMREVLATGDAALAARRSRPTTTSTP